MYSWRDLLRDEAANGNFDFLDLERSKGREQCNIGKLEWRLRGRGKDVLLLPSSENWLFVSLWIVEDIQGAAWIYVARVSNSAGSGSKGRRMNTVRNGNGDG